MARLRSRLVFMTATGCLCLLAALVTAHGQQMQAPDPERGFAFGDTNLDGKLSLDEFVDLLRNGPRLKKAAVQKTPAQLEPIFRRLDTDHNGFLTIQEFRKLAQLRAAFGGGPFAKGAMAKKQAARVAAAKPAPKFVAEKPITSEQAKFFETKIRPVLIAKCAQCHASDSKKIKGGLLVDTREGLLKGGDTGPAIVPGDLEESLLITAVRYKDEALQMPPKTRLPDAVVADFEAWVKMGAPDPRSSKKAAPATDSAKAVDREQARRFWSFQPPKTVPPPKVRDTSWPKSDLDRFILAALEEKGLKPVADAADQVDVNADAPASTSSALPPTPEEVEAFVADTSPDAFAKVVDRLLNSPRFGERWGRHWLSTWAVVRRNRAAKANMMYPPAWRYRDWVIAAFNADKPYDPFVRQQIAGDLLPAQGNHRGAENIIATGFLAVGSKTHNTQDRRQFVLDLADEQIDVTSQAFLGLTIACARCHDHKFDPISQRDYYALAGIFQEHANLLRHTSRPRAKQQPIAADRAAG